MTTPITRARGFVGLSVLIAGFALAGPAGAAPGRPGLAPGRVVFPVDGGITSGNVDGGGASQVAALPTGGAVLIGGGGAASRGFYAAQLTPTGSLDPSFGSRGVTRVALASRVMPLQLLVQADGKLVVVASTAAPGQPLVVVRLDVNGSLDPGFGSGGIAPVPIAAGCVGCTTAALAPDGDLVLTGKTTGAGGANWVIARLTPTGALDQTFGPAGILTLPASDASGYDVAVLGNDDIVTLGLAGLSAGSKATALLTRLTPMGLPELDFNGGVPAELPPSSGAFAMLVYPDESVLVGGSTALFRFNSVGAPDTTFGLGGVARTGTLPFPLQLLPAAGGAVVAVGPRASSPSSLSAVRVAADGSLDPSLGGPSGIVAQPAFGGGGSSVVSSVRPRPLPPLVQNSFVARSVAARPDGSYLAVGGVGVSQPTGEGTGRSIFDFAGAALGPSFTPDTGFGGTAGRLTMKLSVLHQAAGTAHSRHGVAVRIDLSAPGLARVTIKARGRVLAQSVLPAFGSGARTLPVELTTYGASLLGSARRVHVTASASARGLLSAAAHASASGTLG
jgi:uncharacterized delta-60 repeat protein